MRLLPQTENVPPRRLRALGAVFCFFQDLKVVGSMGAAFGKRNDVIDLVRSAVEFLSGFALVLRDLMAANPLRNTPLPRGTHCKDSNGDKDSDDHSSRLVGRVSPGKHEGNGCEHSSYQHESKIMPSILSTPVNAEQQKDPDYHCDRKESSLLLSERSWLLDRLLRRNCSVELRLGRRRLGRNSGIDLRILPPKGKFGSGLVSPSGLSYVNAVTLASVY
jgi:hypothetical protein